RSDIVPVAHIVPHRGCSQHPDGNDVCRTSVLSALRSTAGISGNTRLVIPMRIAAECSRLAGAKALLTLECRGKVQHPTRATWRSTMFTPRTSMHNPSRLPSQAPLLLPSVVVGVAGVGKINTSANSLMAREFRTKFGMGWWKNVRNAGRFSLLVPSKFTSSAAPV
ncbi:hypothetical protein B0H14DRAFT_2768368, partial [Mycena olivaceomarginata]